MTKHLSSFPDHNQNFWQLASIQTASIGVNGIISSKIIAESYDPGIVIVSVFIGNLFLWMIGFSIVSMAVKTKNNAIENAQAFIGNYGAKLAALISLTVFASWQVIQMQSTTNYIDKSFGGAGFPSYSTVSMYGIVLGVLIAVISMFGLIHYIKRLNVVLLPILVLYYLYSVVASNDVKLIPGKLEVSIPCIVAYMTYSFAGMVNLPTFFRHARTKYDSYIALTLITVIISFFQIASIWIPHSILSDELLYHQLNRSFWYYFLFKFGVISFCVMLLLCSNLVNIYFSQPSLEIFFPRIRKSILCFAIGLLAASLYAVVQIFLDNNPLMYLIESITDNSIANLGTALLLIFLVRIIVRHRPKPFEKLIGVTAWIVGCIATALSTTQGFAIPPLLTGIAATTIFYIVVFFIEEPFWSIKKLRKILNQSNSRLRD